MKRVRSFGGVGAWRVRSNSAVFLRNRDHGSEEHASTGTSLNNLALLLKAKGDYAQAEPLLRRGLAIAEKAHGPEHPEQGLRHDRQQLADLCNYRSPCVNEIPAIMEIQ